MSGIVCSVCLNIQRSAATSRGPFILYNCESDYLLPPATKLCKIIFSEACVKNSAHWGQAWQGACMAGGMYGRGACVAGGMHGRYYKIRSMSMQYSSCCNALLFLLFKLPIVRATVKRYL